MAIANQHDMHTVGLIFRYYLEGKLNVSMSKIMMCTIGETFEYKIATVHCLALIIGLEFN